MNIFPSGEQKTLLLNNHSHRAADIRARHALNPDQFGRAIWPTQIDLGMAIAKDVNMGRMMVIDKNDDAQTMSAKYGDHAEGNNPSGWVCQ